jgi:hypothetical protein
MTRRTAAVLRVARLQESAARGAIGRAMAAKAEAELAHEQAVADLAATPAPAGSALAATAAHSTRLRRAESAHEAADRVEEARTEVTGALARWQAMRQRRQLVAELDARQRSLEALEAERVQQRFIDDLNAGQAARRGVAS